MSEINLFGYLTQILKTKDPELFNKLTDKERLNWSTYMINRYLSMDLDNIDLVSFFSKYSFSLEPETVYEFYRCIIPKRNNTFIKYTKSKSEISENDKEFINKLCEVYNYSKQKAKEYSKFYTEDDKEEFMKSFGIISKTKNKKVTNAKNKNSKNKRRQNT